MNIYGYFFYLCINYSTYINKKTLNTEALKQLHPPQKKIENKI